MYSPGSGGSLLAWLLPQEKKHTQELERKNLELEREKTLFEGEALRSLQQVYTCMYC